jgi:hypothetical protein
MSKSKESKIPQAKCYRHGTVVWYPGGKLESHNGNHAIVTALYNDGETVDLTHTVNGVDYQYLGVPHQSRLKDSDKPLSDEALRQRGVWGTLDEDLELWRADQAERIERAEAREKAEQDALNRTKQIRASVIKEASADGANFEQIALKYGVTESEVREWVFATASV